MGGSNPLDPLLVGALGVLCYIALVGFIHFITVNCLRNTDQTLTALDPSPNMHRSRRPRIRINRDFNSSASGLSSIGLSTLLTVHKYTKEFKEGTCAVCLGEFEENDDVRIMPECAHVFHVSCIDMWLFSHDNCPLCRANATSRTHDVLLSILTSRAVE